MKWHVIHSMRVPILNQYPSPDPVVAYTTGAYALVFLGVWERIQFIYFQF
jgi:hypothetical protein